MPKKWICALALLLVGKVSAAEKPDFFKELAAGKKETVVVYGTSLSHGGEWAKAMKKWFDEKYPGQIEFVNNSGPGQHSSWGLQHVEEKVVKLQPGLVLVEFAFNDARDKYNVSVKQAEGNLEKIVAAVQKGSPGTEIVLQVMNVGWDVPGGNQSDSWRPKLQDYNDNYRKLAKARGFDLIDHYAAWAKLKKDDPRTFQKYIPDGTHPDATGSLAITWPGVKAWLEKRSGK